MRSYFRHGIDFAYEHGQGTCFLCLVINRDMVFTYVVTLTGRDEVISYPLVSTATS